MYNFLSQGEKVLKNDDLKKQLKIKLKELFQFENEDLDFGIYRIMNYKRKEIEKYIENDLIKDIQNQLKSLDEEEKNKLKEELEKIILKINEAFGNNAFKNGDLKKEFKNTPLGKEYYEKKKELEQIKLSDSLEKDIYNHLINFFSRYYEDGDFISKRRYGKKEKYVIPYNGEEVYLYWVNKNQYYIKTTEYFRKYTFKIKDLIVNFKVVEAEEEKGNIKSKEKKFFVLNEKIFDFDEEKNELNIYFEYRGIPEKEAQEKNWGDKNGKNIKEDKINEEIIKILEEKIPENSVARLIFEKEEDKTLIKKHLYRYIRKNTADFFIHKDLKEFLEKELDFYIKNEILKLEDLRILKDNLFLKIETFKNISLKIIEFLAQIENFQKKLWEKKKFVIDTYYVITLDKIKEYAGDEFLESILDKILSNEKQIKEWRDLFDIEVKNKNDLIEKDEEYKKLPVDTKYFDEEFKWDLLVALSKKDLDEILDGVLIKSENFQGLNLLLNKYYEKIQTIYIDPPFNTGKDFLYKDNYQDSTWLTLMENRLTLAKKLIKEDGSLFLHLDYNANYRGRELLNNIFGKDKFKNEIIWSYISGGIPEKEGFAKKHDTIFLYGKSNKIFFNQIKEIKQKYSNIDTNKVYEDEKGKYVWYIKPGKNPKKPNGVKTYIEGVLRDVWDIPIVNPQSYELSGFRTQKPEKLLERIIKASTNENDLIIDFFLGSGTTIAVAHKLKRKWIGIEMGEHFYTVILPRIKKVLFYDKSGISKEKDVKEKYNPKMAGGFFKYHTLEQYEDALENIEFEDMQKNIFEFPDYFVKYMLEWETKKSKTFLKINELKNPFNYRLKVLKDYQQKEVNVDLIETFNYLLGLNIKGYKVLKENNKKYLFVFGEKDGKKIAIVWRNIENIDFKKDKEVIENTIKDFNPDEIYINKDAIIKGFKPIEPLFKLLMFEEII